MHNEADEIKGSYDHGFAAGRAEGAAEVERLRAALQFISTYEGSLDKDAYIRLRNHADDALRLNQQNAEPKE